MSQRKVFCSKLQKEAEGLSAAPYPGVLGQRILQEVSAEAWQLWVGEMTKLMNEMRLSPIEPKDRELIETKMCAFLQLSDA